VETFNLEAVLHHQQLHLRIRLVLQPLRILLVLLLLQLLSVLLLLQLLSVLLLLQLLLVLPQLLLVATMATMATVATMAAVELLLVLRMVQVAGGLVVHSLAMEVEVVLVVVAMLNPVALLLAVLNQVGQVRVGLVSSKVVLGNNRSKAEWVLDSNKVEWVVVISILEEHHLKLKVGFQWVVVEVEDQNLVETEERWSKSNEEVRGKKM
jgi:hypothetical protein